MVCPIHALFRCSRLSGYLTLLLCLLSLCFGCSASEIEITVTRKTSEASGHEMWYLYSPGTSEVLYISWTIPSNSIETRSICIPRTHNLQYDLRLTNDDDTWNIESYLELVNVYGNRVFKTPSSVGPYRLSLLYAIEKGAPWVWRNDFVKDWTLAEEGWSRPSTFPSSPVHYIRQTFEGINNMASYEVKFLYQYGIVAYLNGIEIYRDNMPNGPILRTTSSISSSSSYDYRGTIRNGFECSSEESILAVEIHLPSSATFMYDAWLAIYGSSLGVENSNICYSIPLGDIHDERGRNMSMVAEYDVSKYALYTSLNPDSTYLEFSIPTAQVMGFTQYTHSMQGFFTQFRVSINNRITNEFDYNNVTNLMEDWSTSLYFIYFMSSNIPNTNTVRLYPYRYKMLPAWINQLRLYSCYWSYSLQKAVLRFSDHYSLYVNEIVTIKPSNAGAFSCDILDPLPEGLTLNGCSIEGTPIILQSSTEYDIYVNDYMGTRIQTIQLAVVMRGNQQNTNSFPTAVVVIVVLVVAIVIVLLFTKRCRSIAKPGPAVNMELPVISSSNWVDGSHNTVREIERLSPVQPSSGEGYTTPAQPSDEIHLTPVTRPTGEAYLTPNAQLPGEAYKQPMQSSSEAFKQPSQPSGEAYLTPIQPSSGAYKQPTPIQPSGEAFKQPIQPSGEAFKQPTQSSSEAFKQPSRPSGEAYKQPTQPSSGEAYKQPIPSGPVISKEGYKTVINREHR